MIFGSENRRLYINFDIDRRFRVDRASNGNARRVEERLIELVIDRGVYDTYYYFNIFFFFVCLNIHRGQTSARSIEKWTKREEQRKLRIENRRNIAVKQETSNVFSLKDYRRKVR